MKTMKRKEKKALEAQVKAQQAARNKKIARWTVFGVAVVLAFIGLPMLLASAVMAWFLVKKRPDRLYTKTSIWFGVIPASVAFVLLASYWEAYTGVAGGEVTVARVITLVTFGCAFAPLFGGLAAKTWRGRREAQPVNGPDAVKTRREQEDSRRSQSAQKLQEWAFTESDGLPGQLKQRAGRRGAVPLGTERGPYLGRYLDGDLGEPWRSKNGKYAMLNAKAMGPVLVAVGRTGSGKSESVLRVAEWALEQGDQVLLLNGKEAAPGKEPSRRLLAHAESLGVAGRVLVPSVSPWDFMRGTPAQVRNRLMAAELFSEPHHEAGTNMTLAFALHKLAQEGRPAGQIIDVMKEAVDRKKVAQWAAGDPFAAKLLSLVDERSWAGAVQRFTANAMDLQGWTAPAAAGGWAFEDARLCCIDLPTSSEPRAAQMMLRFALSDLEAYLKDESRRLRRPDGSFVPLTVVVEELSALDDDPVIGRKVVNLLERVRSDGGRVVVVAQDLQGTGDERTQNALLNNGTVLAHGMSSDDVEKIAQSAGTRQQAEASGTYDGNFRALSRMNSGSVRMQEAYAVHPNDIRNLRRGEAFVISGGKWMKVAGTMSQYGYAVPETEGVKALDQAFAQARERRASETQMLTPPEVHVARDEEVEF